jgi:hypothetical protein
LEILQVVELAIS